MRQITSTMGLTMKISYVFMTYCLLTLVEVNSLQCYQCQNCAKVSDSQLVTCGTSPESEQTTIQPEDTTALNTTAPDVETPTEDNTTIQEVEITTVANTNVTEVENGTASNITDDNPLTQEFSAVRAKRAIEVNDAECSCQEGYCNCGGKVFFSSFANFLDNATYTPVCITETLTTNVTTINRGCGIEVNSTTSFTCAISGYSGDCKVCKTDGCNSGRSLASSFAVLIPAVLMYLKI